MIAAWRKLHDFNLNFEQNDLSASLLRVILLFLESAALHAVAYDTTEYSSFRFFIRRMRDDFEKTNSGPSALLLAGGAIKLTETYNRGAEKFCHAHSSEMQAILTLMG